MSIDFEIYMIEFDNITEQTGLYDEIKDMTEQAISSAFANSEELFPRFLWDNEEAYQNEIDYQKENYAMITQIKLDGFYQDGFKYGKKTYAVVALSQNDILGRILIAAPDTYRIKWHYIGTKGFET